MHARHHSPEYRIVCQCKTDIRPVASSSRWGINLGCSFRPPLTPELSYCSGCWSIINLFKWQWQAHHAYTLSNKQAHRYPHGARGLVILRLGGCCILLHLSIIISIQYGLVFITGAPYAKFTELSVRNLLQSPQYRLTFGRRWFKEIS